jgi:hypothetical protein
VVEALRAVDFASKWAATKTIHVGKGEEKLASPPPHVGQLTTYPRNVLLTWFLTYTYCLADKVDSANVATNSQTQ